MNKATKRSNCPYVHEQEIQLPLKLQEAATGMIGSAAAYDSSKMDRNGRARSTDSTRSVELVQTRSKGLGSAEAGYRDVPPLLSINPAADQRLGRLTTRQRASQC